MCGIIGFLAKRRELGESLGRLVTPMLDCMASRGPDSAGLAVFDEPLKGEQRRFCLVARDRSVDWTGLAERLRGETGALVETTLIARHASLVSTIAPQPFRHWLAETYPCVDVLSVGRSIRMFKDEGHPRELIERYGFAALCGSHAVAHTRMATESMVSPAHSHPFTAGEDFCLVHNGSLSNPHSIRRRLERRGIAFETDNDTEAGCRFLEWRMREGDLLEQAIERAFVELDGFFTFLMATAQKLVLVRDAFACKPAVAAETDDYVAVSSEFRSLAHLPGIAQADVFEPAPQRIYSWNVVWN